MLVKLGQMQVRHPLATGLVLAAMGAYSAWAIYGIGRIIGSLRMMDALDARAASEALGG